MQWGNMAAGTSVKLVIPSEIKLIDLVHAASEKVAELAGFDADDALNVGLAVREAVINAMLHGNKRDPGLKVSVTLTWDHKGLQARVTDEGNGFDPGSAPNPTTPANLMNDSGRGLLLMDAFVDTLKIKSRPQGGTEVTMTKQLPVGEGDKGDK